MLPQKKQTSLARLLFQLTLAAASALAIALPMDSAAAQSLNPVIPEGTIVRIDGSSSMATVNETLKKYIETQYPETKIVVGYRGTQEALASLKAGQIDLAAIGRPLTAEEKADGFFAYPLSRRKIAIVVSADNTFEGSLSHKQFAGIFRGEIDDWSEIGGDRGSIRLVDRPSSSDTRQAFQIYPIFQERPFEPGDNTLQLEKDSTAALIAELDKNAIGYAIADQAVNRPELRILLMHNAFVTETAYPFSQPRYYAYRKDNTSAAVQSFLGLIATPDGERAIESANSGEKTAISAGLLALAPDFSRKTPVPSATVEENEETVAGIASPDGEETLENEESVAIAPANSSASQSSSSGVPEETTTARVDSVVEADEDRDDNSAIFWWFLAFAGLLGLVGLWLNKQKAASLVKLTLGLPAQSSPVASALKPAKPSPKPQPTPEAKKIPSSPVVPPTPAAPPKVETAPPPVVPPTPAAPPKVETVSPPVVPPTPAAPPKVETVSPPVVPPTPAAPPKVETAAKPDKLSVPSTAIAGAVAIGAGVAAIAGREKETQQPQQEDKLEAVNLPSNSYGTLTVNSRINCYVLDTQQLAALESGSNTIELNPGIYVIRIESGLFNYWPQFQQKFAGEPWVLLWFYGGKFINKKTNLEVGCTWAALNGYEDTITLEVIETLKLSALFFDTYKDDNEGQITLSILKDE